MEEKVKGIVIGGVNYGENDRILTIFTLEKGVVSAKIKGVKKPKAKLKFAAEPFCFAEYVFSFSQGKRTVIGASLIDSFYPLRENINRYFCAGAVIEFLRKFLKEGITAPNTLLLTAEVLRELAYGDQAPNSLLAWFLVEGLKQVGYGLNYNDCFCCGKSIENRVFFDYASGAFYCDECNKGRAREINFKTYLTIRKVANREEVSNDDAVFALRLLDYYLVNKTEEKLASLSELIKL